MANYLLLRNNKESGPYSLDDLTKLGLKAYDLLWVQGKSAAWRYPSEIDELKPIAPVVEEQPFDRFYKKGETATEEKKIETPVAVAPVVAEVRYEKPAVQTSYREPVAEPQYEKYIPKKSVAVTMPGQKNFPVQQPARPIQQPVAREEVPVPEPPRPTITISENPAAAQIKYSQPLDEIKEMYVKTLQDRKQKIARKSFWLQNLKRAAAILALVAIGVIAGFMLKPNKNKQVASNTLIEKQSQPAVLKSASEEDIPETKTTSKSAEPATQPVDQPMHQPSGGYVNKLPEIRNQPVEPKQQTARPANNTEKKVVADNPGNASNTTSFAPQNAETNAFTGERNRKVRSETNEIINNSSNTNYPPAVERKSSSPASELASLVTVKSNNYKRVAFGGIRDLQITVVNDSKYILDNVTVELLYIKPNELPLRAENIEFTSVAPNATSTIRVPDTNRGIRVVFRVIRIKKRAADERVADN